MGQDQNVSTSPESIPVETLSEEIRSSIYALPPSDGVRAFCQPVFQNCRSPGGRPSEL